MNLKFVACTLLLTLVSAGQSVAQPWPAKPLRIILPSPAGGPIDTAARLTGAKLAEALGQAVIIENRPGADGMIAATASAKAAPDGYNFFISNAGIFTINPTYHGNLPYDPDRDFVPISQLTTAVLVVSVRPSLKVGNVRELVDMAKAAPGKLTYAASTGRSGIAFLSMELLKQKTNADITWVAYKDDSQALNDLMAERIDIYVDALATSLPNAQAGKLKLLAVTGSRPAPQVPNVPTIADSGFPGVVGDAWIGLFAPTGTAAEIRMKMEQQVVAVLRDPLLRERLTAMGLDPVGSTAGQLGEVVKRDREKWGRLIKDLGIKP